MTLQLSDLTPEFLDAIDAASVWRPVPVALEPGTSLTQWRVYQVVHEDTSSIHFVGYAGYEGRVSSPVRTYNMLTKQATTESGRVYTLIDESGFNGDAMHTFNRWCSRFPKETVFVDITSKYE